MPLRHFRHVVISSEAPAGEGGRGAVEGSATLIKIAYLPEGFGEEKTGCLNLLTSSKECSTNDAWISFDYARS
jgi:hypothetical protein